jgi:hypothetical protein
MANRRIEMPESLLPLLRRLRLHVRQGRSLAVASGLEQLLTMLDQQGDWLTRLASLERRVTLLEQGKADYPQTLEQVRSPQPDPRLVTEANLADHLKLPRQQLKQLRLAGQRLEATWHSQPVIACYSHRGGKGGFHLWRLDPVGEAVRSDPP